MHIFRYLFICFLGGMSSVCPVFAQNLLPVPAHIRHDAGHFVLTSSTCLCGNLAVSELEREAIRLRAAIGQPLKVAPGCRDGNAIALIFTEKYDAEAYSLRVDGDGIRIESGSGSGFFYAFQTLAQLLDGNRIPFVDITDSPRFPYRGMMIDCSRHFWGIDFLKRQIDIMSRFKMNRLHLHLTDAGGWRMEIKAYPLLTKLVSYRTESDWLRWWVGNDRRYCGKGSPGSYGGFYSQEDLRELVRYAADREVTIIPEIEMPGHSEEVLFAYPALKCQGAGDEVGDLCLGSETTFKFLEEVLLEVMSVFPSTYIHIGGDESGGDAWGNCGRCRARMLAEGFESPRQLQGYLTSRMGRFLKSHGRVLMGWDEIMDDSLDCSSVVMSWRGESGGITAARQGHNVVMSPAGFCYLDGYQDAPSFEPRAFGGYLPLEQVYSYNPIPETLRQAGIDSLIIGLQGNLWTEMIVTPEHAEYMLYPRILAIAERGWSPFPAGEPADYADFRRRVLALLPWLRSQGCHPFDLANEKGSRPESRSRSRHGGIGKRVLYKTLFSDTYRASGMGALTDGLCGDWSFNDGRWQGFIGKEGIDIVVDMGKKTPVHDVSIAFMQFSGPEIFEPGELALSVSNDGKSFKDLICERTEVSRDRDYFIRRLAWKGSAHARYVRLRALPGQFGGWLFTDEIIINADTPAL